MRIKRERQGHRLLPLEKQAPYGEPDAELDLRTLGSQHELKVDAQPLSYPGIPSSVLLSN